MVGVWDTVGALGIPNDLALKPGRLKGVSRRTDRSTAARYGSVRKRRAASGSHGKPDGASSGR